MSRDLYPGTFYRVSSRGGSASDVGEIRDPDLDVPTALPCEGISDVGDYLVPEEGP